MKPLLSLVGTLWLAITLCSGAIAQAIPLHTLQARQGVVIDTRPSAYYNGWPDQGTSGHEPGALNLAADWLSLMDDTQLRAWLSDHHLDSQRTWHCTAHLRRSMLPPAAFRRWASAISNR